MSDMGQVTGILAALERGDPLAADQLLPLVYDELRRLAAQRLAREQPGHTLDPTALVHEAYLRLLGSDPVQGANSRREEECRFANRRHFFAAAAQAMQRILVESARRRRSLKRGGGQVRQNVEDLDLLAAEPREDLVALDEALQRLAAVDARAAQVVQLRFFAGFDLLEAAEIMGVAPRTAYRLWAYARAWLRRELQEDRPKNR